MGKIVHVLISIYFPPCTKHAIYSHHDGKFVRFLRYILQQHFICEITRTFLYLLVSLVQEIQEVQDYLYLLVSLVYNYPPPSKRFLFVSFHLCKRYKRYKITCTFLFHLHKWKKTNRSLFQGVGNCISCTTETRQTRTSCWGVGNCTQVKQEGKSNLVSLAQVNETNKNLLLGGGYLYTSETRRNK